MPAKSVSATLVLSNYVFVATVGKSTVSNVAKCAISIGSEAPTCNELVDQKNKSVLDLLLLFFVVSQLDRLYLLFLHLVRS